MRERLRANSMRTGLATLAALFVFGGDHASAQDTRSYVERQGFRAYEAPSGDRLRTSPANTATFSVNTEEAPHFVEPLPVFGRARTTTSEDDEIVVTAPIVGNFSSTENSEFDESFLDRMGVEQTSNPDLEGLAFLTPEEMRDNGWALNIPVLGSRRGQTGPFLSVGAGRPERIVAAGVRF